MKGTPSVVSLRAAEDHACHQRVTPYGGEEWVSAAAEFNVVVTW
jgi:hypothetical protein